MKWISIVTLVGIFAISVLASEKQINEKDIAENIIGQLLTDLGKAYSQVSKQSNKDILFKCQLYIMPLPKQLDSGSIFADQDEVIMENIKETVKTALSRLSSTAWQRGQVEACLKLFDK